MRSFFFCDVWSTYSSVVTVVGLVTRFLALLACGCITKCDFDRLLP